MRRLEDFTNDELVQLDDAGFDALVEIECAHEGIPMLPDHPGEAPTKADDLEPTVTLHEVAGYSFLTHEDAIEVAELIGTKETATTGYVSGPSYTQKIRKTEKRVPDVTTSKAYSEEQANRIAARLERYESKSREWEAAHNEYEGIARKREKVRTRVHEAVRAAREYEERILRTRATFDRYLALADNDAHIAWRFFKQAYSSMAEDEKVRDMLRPADFVDEVEDSETVGSSA